MTFDNANAYNSGLVDEFTKSLGIVEKISNRIASINERNHKTLLEQQLAALAIYEQYNQIVQKAKEIGTSGMEKSISAVRNISQSVVNCFYNMGDTIESIKSKIQGGVLSMGQFIQKAAQFGSTGIEQGIERVRSIAQSVAIKFGEIGGKIETVKGKIQGSIANMAQFVQRAREFASTGLEHGLDAAYNASREIVTSISNLGSKMDIVKGKVLGGVDNMVAFVQRAREFASSGLEQGLDAVYNVSRSIANSFNNIGAKMGVVKNKIQGCVANMGQMARQAMTFTRTRISQGMTKLGDTLKNVRTRLFSAVNLQDRFRGIIDRARGGMDRLRNSLQSTRGMRCLQDVQNYNDGLEEAKDNLGETVSKQDNLASTTQQAEQSMKNLSSAAAGVGENVAKSGGKMSAFKAGVDSLVSKVKEISGISSVKDILDIADTVTKNKIQLDAMNDGLQSTDILQNKIYQSAQNCRAAYGDFQQRVVDLSSAAEGVFHNNDEAIGFAELMQKNFASGKLSADQQAAAMDSLTQSMMNGTMSSEDMQNMLNGAPALAQSLANELGVSTDKLAGMAASGDIAAGAMKNAMFASADETNAKFAEMPYTFSELWTMAKDSIMEIFEPLLTKIGEAATWIGENWGTIEPILQGLAVAVAIVTAVWVIYNAVLAANPIMFIVMAIIAIITAIVAWIQKVGGLKIAWLIVVDAIKTAWSGLYMKIMTIGNKIQQFLMGFRLGWLRVRNAIVGYVLDLGVNVLTGLQDLINGAIGLVNQFITTINDIFGTSIQLVQEVTFAAGAAAEAEAQKQAMEDDVTNQEKAKEDAQNEFEQKLADYQTQAMEDHLNRQKEISDAQAAQEQKAKDSELKDPVNSNPNAGKGSGSGSGGGGRTAENVEAIKNSMDTTVEELKYLRDIAEQEAINRFTTAEIKIDMTNNNNIASDIDLDGIVEGLEEKLQTAMASAAEGVA